MPTPTPTPTSTWLSLLRVIPDTEATRSEVIMNDYARVRELFDIPLPGPDVDLDAFLEEYLLALFPLTGGGPRLLGDSTFISGMAEYGAITRKNFHDYLAFDVRNIDQSAYAGVPPQRFEVLRGRFDPQATERALAACSECPPPLIEEHRGVPFYSWGEDLEANIQMRLAPPAFDQFGRGGRIAVQEEYIFRTVETPGMRLLIRAATGGSSLADVEEYGLLAQGLEELGAYGAFMTDNTQSMEDTLALLVGEEATAETAERLKRQLEEELQEAPMLEPYQVFATGPGLDAQGPYMAVVLVHAGESAARDNVGLLRQRVQEGISFVTAQPWTEFIEEVEVRSQGRVLLAKLRGERAALMWLQFVMWRDPLLLHR